MRESKRWIGLCCAAWLALTLPAAADPQRRVAPGLTPEEQAAYGSRSDFFRLSPPQFRPDLDWRSALSPSLADAEPRWSQGFEELIIRDYFGDRKAGFYVDVGCYEPRESSTTYDLEERRGWKGVGIDVNEAYRESWKLHRPRSTFVHAAVSDTDGEILKLQVAGAFRTLDEEMGQRLIKSMGVADQAEVLEVETSTLNTILEQQGVEKIDFLSMDIEGAELAALRGFDIQRYRPDLSCIETKQHDEVVAYFEANGYELVEKYRKVDKINLYFRPKPGR